ncbi:MAG TPA: hypothetical protein VFK20_04040, partial [Vicinamibacterales bacterium]|nr:hypothetical protein [Vicinamibacterales bacterium]
FTVEQLPEGVPLEVRAFVRTRGNISGGTDHSAITAFSRARHMAAAARERALATHTAERRANELIDIVEGAAAGTADRRLSPSVL